MAISGKVLKELWGKSGDRCAICNIKLHQQGSVDSYGIGENCHIISKQKNGPRHIDGLQDYDSYDNLILLCKNHHKEIDSAENISIYSQEKLLNIKSEHEKMVDSLLNNGGIQYIKQLKSEINNLQEKGRINELLRKCRMVLSELYGENDFLISELSNIDFSTHLVNEGKIDNTLHLKIVGFDYGKKRLLELLDNAIIRSNISCNNSMCKLP